MKAIKKDNDQYDECTAIEIEPWSLEISHGISIGEDNDKVKECLSKGEDEGKDGKETNAIGETVFSKVECKIRGEI